MAGDPEVFEVQDLQSGSERRHNHIGANLATRHSGILQGGI